MNAFRDCRGMLEPRIGRGGASSFSQFGRAYQVNNCGVVGIAEDKPAESAVHFAIEADLLWRKCRHPSPKRNAPKSAIVMGPSRKIHTPRCPRDGS